MFVGKFIFLYVYMSDTRMLTHPPRVSCQQCGNHSKIMTTQSATEHYLAAGNERRASSVVCGFVWLCMALRCTVCRFMNIPLINNKKAQKNFVIKQQTFEGVSKKFHWVCDLETTSTEFAHN